VQHHLPLGFVPGTRIIRCQAVIEWVGLGDDDQIVEIIRAVGSGVAKEATCENQLVSRQYTTE
jgi:hypothetical protein